MAQKRKHKLQRRKDIAKMIRRTHARLEQQKEINKVVK